MTPYYDEGGITIYHGNCLDVLGSLDASESLVITDPPYNIGVDYGHPGWSDDLDPLAYERFNRIWFERAYSKQRIVFPGLANLPMWVGAVRRPTAIGCWYIPGNPGRGFPWSFIEWEPILIYGNTFMGGSNVFRYPITAQRDVGSHPCPKPLRLFTQLIQRVKDLDVVDPFMGSGTALRAAKDLGRRAIGIEVNESYCEIAAKRLAQEVLDFGAA